MRYKSLRTPTPTELAEVLEERGEPIQLIPDDTLVGTEVKVSSALLKLLTTWLNRKEEAAKAAQKAHDALFFPTAQGRGPHPFHTPQENARAWKVLGWEAAWSDDPSIITKP